MAIMKFQDNLNIIGMLSDYPGSEDGLTTQEFKNLFDKAGLLIQQYINNTLIPNIENTIPGLYSVTMDLKTVVLTVKGWANFTQTVNVDKVLANANEQAIISTAAPASLETYLDSNIRMTGQGAGTLTFSCDEVPATSVAVNILILTKGA